MPVGLQSANATMLDTVRLLLNRGVRIPCPEAVEIGHEVDPERIAPGVIIHPGCRISGAETSIGPECRIGSESPASVENCQLGRGVGLKGGYFSGATFLERAEMGSAAHVRAGTLLEEQASGAHAVGLKQTIFLPYVTAGSLINFCDVLMAGGTSRKNHSEIGSSYIHFNFTPHQDKATPSLVGDVPRGVMLDRPPVFLGGQGGLVGPARIAFGTVVAAGTICRTDVLEEERLVVPPPLAIRPPGSYRSGAYRAVNRIVANNLIFIGNLRALRAWYQFVRLPAAGDAYARWCAEGAVRQIDSGLEERIRRLGELAAKMPASLKLAAESGGESLPESILDQQRALAEQWPRMEDRLRSGPAPDTGAAERDRFLAQWERAGRSPYLEAIAALHSGARCEGTAWLQAIVDAVAGVLKRT